MSYTKEQIILQTFLENGLVPQRDVNFASSIASVKNASPRQLLFVQEKINVVMRLQGAQSQSNSAPAFDEKNLFRIFDNALKALKKPKITLQFKDGSPLRLAMSPKYPDTIWLSAGGYGTLNYGSIRRGNGFILLKDKSRELELTDIVKNFSADPEGVSASYGKLTHHCCYCLKHLTTAESLAVGYGPDCAEHYDLAWGKNVKPVLPSLKELLEDQGTTMIPSAKAALAHTEDMDHLENEF